MDLVKTSTHKIHYVFGLVVTTLVIAFLQNTATENYQSLTVGFIGGLLASVTGSTANALFHRPR